MKMISLMVLLPLAALAQPQPRLVEVPQPPAPPAPPPPPGGGREMLPGIPPDVAQRLGIPSETVKKVRDLSFDANEQLITLEADMKRAHLELQRQLAQSSPDEGVVMQKLEAISKAELALKKNRIALMLKIRKLLGPEVWSKLEAEGSHERRGADLYEQLKRE
jgi:hypothetical protein